jgi:acetyl esterase/lipase
MTSSLASPIARPPLEPVTAAFAATLDGPPPYELSLEQARAGLPALQAAAGAQRPPALIEDRVIPGGPTGEVAIRIVRPLGLATPAPVVVYSHGGGWVFGDPGTHDRVVRELAVAAHAALVFVDYTRAPEARHPVQVRQGEILLAWIAEHGAMAGLDPGRVAVAGDSSGANLATVWAMLSGDRPGIDLAAQVLFFPTVDAGFDSGSYREFAAGPYLDEPTMRWFWDHYLPDVSRRVDPTASPLRASLDALRGLPPALVITAESDVLRDEGESYARRLAEAGVDVTAVRYLGTMHAFVVLDALARTPAARAAIAQAGGFLRDRLSSRAADARPRR